MDRNGKKPKAARTDLHPERSDTKSQSRDVLGRTDADVRLQSERAGAERPGTREGRKGSRP
jgi:hypothetical protein